jgi:sterol desaturase/sphingolipid hydroxylase (fatty acid hydroxylase superfamily)
MLETILPASVTGPILGSMMWLAICGCLFGFLQHLTPLDPDQKQIRPDTKIDLIYWFGAPFMYASLGASLTALGFIVIFSGNMDAAVAWTTNGADYLRDWPLWLQILGVLVVTDFAMYWTHRLFHHAALWRYHAIHHSPTSLDWLHAVRFHPVNMIFHGLLANSIALWVGFPPIAIAALGPFNVLYSCMVHANLNWTFGPLKHVFASPVFHRWHHTTADEGGSKNFAPTFAFLDHMFGTFYMPEGQKPLVTGITEADMPKSLLGQLLYPFMGKLDDDAEEISPTTPAQ